MMGATKFQMGDCMSRSAVDLPDTQVGTQCWQQRRRHGLCGFWTGGLQVSGAIVAADASLVHGLEDEPVVPGVLNIQGKKDLQALRE